MLSFLISPHLFFLVSSIRSAARLCHSSPYCGLNCVLPLYLCLFCAFYSSRAAELSGNPVDSLSRFDYYLTCLSCGHFFVSAFARFPNWLPCPVTHFSWQSPSPKVYLSAIPRQGRDIKAAFAFQTTYHLVNAKTNVFLADILLL